MDGYFGNINYNEAIFHISPVFPVICRHLNLLRRLFVVPQLPVHEQDEPSQATMIAHWPGHLPDFPCITIVGTNPTFYPVPVTKELRDSVMTAQYDSILRRLEVCHRCGASSESMMERGI